MASPMRIEYLLDLGGDLFALLQNGFQASGEPGQHGARDQDGLLVQFGQGVVAEVNRTQRVRQRAGGSARSAVGRRHQVR